MAVKETRQTQMAEHQQRQDVLDKERVDRDRDREREHVIVGDHYHDICRRYVNQP